MAADYNTYLSNLLTNYGELGADLYNMAGKLNSLGNYIAAENWAYAGSAAQGAANYCYDASTDLGYTYDSVRKWSYELFDWIRDNWPSDGAEYELTMAKILDAMWDSDKLRSFHFVNYIDAMRAGIWNTQISEQHLVEWYRHFSE